MNHNIYMKRCFDLARLGAGSVSPNPMVGAVLVHKGRIIGEGWHKRYGQAHAEVNAVASVREEERHLIKDSTIYVSLEPCSIFGKTPPCTGLILKEGIKKVVISCIDHTPGVKGSGVHILENAGVEVIYGTLKSQGEQISRFRNIYTEKQRPYITLKFAQSANGFMGVVGQQVWISREFSKRLVHQMRSEYDAILIGTETALTDNPQLNNRLWYGKSPVRVLLDKGARVPVGHKIFGEEQKTIIVSENKLKGLPGHLTSFQLPFDENLLPNLLAKLAENRLTSLIVEGGAFTLKKFIQQNLWDEAWVFTGDKLITDGIPAPLLSGKNAGSWPLGKDVLQVFLNAFA